MKLKEYQNEKVKESILNIKGEVLKIKDYSEDMDFQDDTCEIYYLLTDITERLNRIQKIFEESKSRDN